MLFCCFALLCAAYVTHFELFYFTFIFHADGFCNRKQIVCVCERFFLSKQFVSINFVEVEGRFHDDDKRKKVLEMLTCHRLQQFQLPTHKELFLQITITRKQTAKLSAKSFFLRKKSQVTAQSHNLEKQRIETNESPSHRCRNTSEATTLIRVRSTDKSSFLYLQQLQALLISLFESAWNLRMTINY